ncbi:hypothetical protein M422DRAFT_783547 [Sphaerobolus stellatus SS14]|uniref:Zn(2)-C6 fungal-type domain-containing protein n=1 Tax=Sphaerobolus stellatus (strain SS14) TaxID=990650 RepID=A0A0C9TPU1_SPHS4|nr:hypothetical protein M422DRAFT_783547 [Sphaerobolus stellatus SS14]
MISPSVEPLSEAVSKLGSDKIFSCMECRRLKLKCDRVFPCLSCRRRGLGALCPNMALSARQRKKVSSLNVKFGPSFSDLTGRIRELEMALAELHAAQSNEPHPLLQLGTQNDEDVEERQEVVGTLKIDLSSGKASFFGETAGIEILYRIDSEKDDTFGRSLEPHIVEDHAESIVTSLLSSMSTEILIEHVESRLPSPLRAWKLCETYYNCAAWLCPRFPRNIFQDQILVPVYSTTPPSVRRAGLGYVEIASLFMIFAVASLVEYPINQNKGEILPLPNNDAEALLYYQLARAVLTVGQCTVEEPTLASIRCLLIMVHYHYLWDRPTTPQTIWSFVSTAFSQAINIGLHRNPESWKLEPSLVEERRNAFWDVILLGSWSALAYGRPPLITPNYYDCDIGPQSRDSNYDYYCRVRLITSTLIVEVGDLVSNLQQKYSDVLLLDSKLRDRASDVFGGPLGCQNVSSEIFEGLETLGRFQVWWLLVTKELLCIHLHRRYFAKVCLGLTEEISTSRYSPSFFAVFRSAQAVIALARSIMGIEAELFCRYGSIFWSHVLGSAIALGSVVIRHPQSNISSEAMKSLEEALSLAHDFYMWTRNCTSSRPAKALEKIQKIHYKAICSLVDPDLTQEERENAKQSDELSVLGGLSRILEDRSQFKNDTSNGTEMMNATSDIGPSKVSELHPSFLDDIMPANEQHSNGTRPTISEAFYPYDVASSSYEGFLPLDQSQTKSEAMIYNANHPPFIRHDQVNENGDTQVTSKGAMSAMNPLLVYRTEGSEESTWQGFIDGLRIF